MDISLGQGIAYGSAFLSAGGVGITFIRTFWHNRNGNGKNINSLYNEELCKHAHEVIDDKLNEASEDRKNIEDKLEKDRKELASTLKESNERLFDVLGEISKEMRDGLRDLGNKFDNHIELHLRSGVKP